MKKIVFTLFLIFTLFVSVEGFSQIVNVQDKLKSDLEEGTHIGLHSSLNNKLGNTNLLAFDAALYAIFNYGNHRLSLLGDASYAYQDSFDIIVSRTFEHLRYNYSFYDWLGIEAFAQHEYDKFRRLYARALVGLGLRFTPVSNEVIDMAIGTAYTFDYNKNLDDGLEDSGLELFLHRWSSYIHISLFIAKQVALYNTLHIQPNVEAFEDFIALLDTHLEVKINEHFYFDIISKLAYDNRPSPLVKELDYSITLGLGFKYSFLSSKEPATE